MQNYINGVPLCSFRELLIWIADLLGIGSWDLAVGWSEKPKSWKSKNGQADYLPRHSPDVRTVFEI